MSTFSFGQSSGHQSANAGIDTNKTPVFTFGHSQQSESPNAKMDGTKVHTARSAHKIDRNVLTTASLNALQGDEQRKILDVVDKLRRDGLSSVLELPQLVVCGDQSSGKSSVLEAITEIPFPRKENLCTRFATEIILRREASSSIATTIVPDATRPQHEQMALRTFSKSINNFYELPHLMDEAMRLMGLGDLKAGGTKAFARDVLRIEICGPNRPQLTLVDLPGLIHSENKVQTKHDVELIRILVSDYIKRPRTIILAVISAKNDYANQVILEHVRTVDKEGTRTLGIITKPDTLRAGSDNEKDWMELARNENILFKLGWHMLKNRADGEDNTSFEARNQAEALFFSRGAYAELPDEDKGIVTLRSKLAELLSEHLKTELPNLKLELEKKLVESRAALAKLGKKRATIGEQRVFLLSIATEANDLLRSAINGLYDHVFFGNVNTAADMESAENARRLRALVQYLNRKFEKNIRQRGHKYDLKDNTTNGIFGKIATNGQSSRTSAATKDRAQAINWVLRILERTRGRELPGNFNPMLIGTLFREQSEGWNAIAMDHVDQVDKACEIFIDALLHHVTTPDVAAKIMSVHIEQAAVAAKASAQQELAKLIADKNGNPMTYNHYYTETLQKHRIERLKRTVKNAYGAKVSLVQPGMFGQQATNKEYIDPDKLGAALDSVQSEPDMDRFSAEEALDCQHAFYKDEMKFFVDAVTKQAIERHLIAKLPEVIVSPNVVAGFSDEQIRYVAGEAPEAARQRAHLEKRIAMLESGQRTFRLAMGAYE